MPLGLAVAALAPKGALANVQRVAATQHPAAHATAGVRPARCWRWRSKEASSQEAPLAPLARISRIARVTCVPCLSCVSRLALLERLVRRHWREAA